MASAVAEKTAEELRKEIDELHRQHREITERLRDPRGLRRAGLATSGVRAAAQRLSGTVRPPADPADQPPSKRRLSSTVVKVDTGDTSEADAVKEEDSKVSGLAAAAETEKSEPSNPITNGVLRRGGNRGTSQNELDNPIAEPEPRVFPKNEDPSLVKRNRRMFGQLLGTLEKFREEDKQLSNTDAFMRRSDSLKRAEEKSREESEKLRKQEREQNVERRRRDLTLRARVAAKKEEKQMELLFLHWSEHHKKLCNFTRTKAQPPIYYMPIKPLVDVPAALDVMKEQEYLKWKSVRRAELSEHQKLVSDQYMTNIEAAMERWQKNRDAQRANNHASLQETMDEELETHRLEHGPKTRVIPGGNNDDEEDVEDIVAEDELMDDVLGVVVPERAEEADDAAKLPETGDDSSLGVAVAE